jgi:PAS domain-containing protein
MMDDTEAYESARALVDVNAQLKLAVDLGQIAIWRHDLRTQRMHYSDRAYRCCSRSRDPSGFRSTRCARSSTRTTCRSCSPRPRRRCIDQPTDMEARYRRADGSYRYVMTRRVVERDESGEPIAFVGVALDVTERVEQRRQAEELARRLEAASRAAGIGLWTTRSIRPRPTGTRRPSRSSTASPAARADASRSGCASASIPTTASASRARLTPTWREPRRQEIEFRSCAATAACAGS